MLLQYELCINDVQLALLDKKGNNKITTMIQEITKNTIPKTIPRVASQAALDFKRERGKLGAGKS